MPHSKSYQIRRNGLVTVFGNYFLWTYISLNIVRLIKLNLANVFDNDENVYGMSSQCNLFYQL